MNSRKWSDLSAEMGDISICWRSWVKGAQPHVKGQARKLRSNDD